MAIRSDCCAATSWSGVSSLRACCRFVSACARSDAICVCRSSGAWLAPFCIVAKNCLPISEGTQPFDVATDGEELVMGRYRLGRRLGAGGFGAVHEAVDERLDRWVAVKVIPADDAAPDRARREAIAAARLEHPGIVAVY